jgi:hypothetical protein
VDDTLAEYNWDDGLKTNAKEYRIIDAAGSTLYSVRRTTFPTQFKNRN